MMKYFNGLVVVIMLILLYIPLFPSLKVFVQRFESSFRIFEEFNEAFLSLRTIKCILAKMRAFYYVTRRHLFKDAMAHLMISIKVLIDRD